jgi:hypothetical protein
VEREPETRVGVIAVARSGRAWRRLGYARNLVARQTQLAIARRRQHVELTELLADQHVRAREVRAAREVEADERNLRAAAVDAAAEQVRVRRQVLCELRESRARIREQTEQPGR